MLAPQLRHDLEERERVEHELDVTIEHSDEHDVEEVVDALYRRGRMRREQHELDAALTDFRHALETVDDFTHRPVTPAYLNRPSILLESARVYLLQGQPVLARCALDFAEEDVVGDPGFPNWADLHVERARLFIAEGELALAEAQLLAAVETIEQSVLDAGLDDIYLELGIIRALQGELDEALTCLEIAHEGAEPHGTNWLRALMALGDVLWLAGARANALRHYDLVLQDVLQRADPVLLEVGTRATICIEQGRAELAPICGDLLEALFEAIIERDGEGIFDTTRQLAWVAVVLDVYPRVHGLVESTACRVASAALAFHMRQLATERGEDTVRFENHIEALTRELPSWELGVALRHLIGA